jgi:hypothetical protein
VIFRTKCPIYLASAIDHATGVTLANEAGQQTPAAAPTTVPGGTAP